MKTQDRSNVNSSNGSQFPVTHSVSFVSFWANATLKAQDPCSVDKNAVSLVFDITMTTLTGGPVSPVFPGFPAVP